MLNRFRSRKRPSSPSLLQRLHTIFKRRGKPTTQSGQNLVVETNEWNTQSGQSLVVETNKWNIPLPPDLMYHIIDSYLATSTIIALYLAFPVLRPYCHSQSYRHITVYIREAWKPLQTIYFKIGISKCPPAREQDNSMFHSTLDDIGYAGTKKNRDFLSLVSDLTHDLTSIELDITVRWEKLDGYVKAYIFALLQRTGLCSAKLKYCNIPVNLLSVVQNLKTLDVDTSLGRPDYVSFPGEREKVYIEEVRLRGGLPYCRLIGAGTPFDWSRLRVIEYYGFQNRPQGLFQLCSSSLQVLDLAFYGEDEYINLGVLTDLRHLTLSISLSYTVEQTAYTNPGTYSSITPFLCVPRILASCNGHVMEKIVLILSTVDRQDLRQCDWLSVDRIFEREGTWMSLKEVLVVNCKVEEDCTYRKLQPNQLKYIEASPTPCLQAREVIQWCQYVRGGIIGM